MLDIGVQRRGRILARKIAAAFGKRIISFAPVGRGLFNDAIIDAAADTIFISTGASRPELPAHAMGSAVAASVAVIEQRVADTLLNVSAVA